MKKIITAKPTRQAAREFIAKAKAEGVTLGQPNKLAFLYPLNAANRATINYYPLPMQSYSLEL